MTIWPAELNVTEPHTPPGTSSCMIVSVSRPSGPDQTFVSVWNASEWMLLRWFGAMNGWRGAAGAKTGLGVHGSPLNCACAAAGAASSSTARSGRSSIGNTLPRERFD